MKYIAHIREKDGDIQTVQEHLNAVQKLCEKYWEKIQINSKNIFEKQLRIQEIRIEKGLLII
ncbi:hypothetical protein HMPREF1210_01411 [Paenisporosarcina sp. HGH0030]|uniref:hypothetical protein n=1 Tax=unclassified Paenisporosarcina TaxID=2642018 RepID=UPI00034ECEE5|nr:hypothetical protein HMPREF1210_01411 [Paenisporosarcina sp. HGH0030]